MTDASKAHAAKFCEDLLINKLWTKQIETLLMSLITERSRDFIEDQALELKKVLDSKTWDKINVEWLQNTEHFAACELTNHQLPEHCSISLSTFQQNFNSFHKKHERIPNYIKDLLDNTTDKQQRAKKRRLNLCSNK